MPSLLVPVPPPEIGRHAGTFGLRLDRDAVRRSAAECRLAGRIPTEFKRVVRNIAAVTTSQVK